MSFYNMMFGYTPACVLIMPMLGRKEEDYPRFRDCFIDEYKNTIIIYTRVGGNNRNCGYGEEELYKDECFISTWDDDFDSTYGYYEFSVPAKWKSDFDKIKEGKLTDVSDDYVVEVKRIFPELAKSGVIDKIFGGSDKEMIQ